MDDKKYPPLPITAAQLADLRIIFAAPAEEITRVDHAIRSLSPPPIRATRLFEAASSVVRDRTLAEAIVRQGISLCAFTTRASMDVKQVIVALESGLSQKNDWKDPAQRRELDRHLGALSNLLTNEAIYLAAKAIELSYEHDRVFTSARIITDIRPVMDQTRSQPRGAVIGHTLRIAYFENNRPIELAIALDQDDLKVLVDACQEGLSKTEVARKMVAGVSAANVFVAGDESYGSD